REPGTVGVRGLIYRGGAGSVGAVPAASDRGWTGVVVARGRSRPVVIEDVFPAVQGGGRRWARRGKARGEGGWAIHPIAEEAGVVVLSRVGKPKGLAAAEDAPVEDRRLLGGRADERLMHPDGVLVHGAQGPGDFHRLDFGKAHELRQDRSEPLGGNRRLQSPGSVLP